MNHIDTMRQALDALEQLRELPSADVWLDRWNETIDALRLAIEQAEKQEPVCETTAWAQAFGAGVKAGRTYLAAKEQEPVAWMDAKGGIYGTTTHPELYVPLYAAPPQHQPLTDEQVCDLWSWSATAEAERTATTQQHAFARAIERAHGIGGDK